MAMPEEYVQHAISIDEDANDIVVRCPECNDYGPKRISGDDYDTADKAMSQAKRQLGSHYSQKHGGGQGGSNEPEGKGGNQKQPSQPPQQSQPPQGGQQPEPQQTPNGQQENMGGEINERELIYRKGEEGLLELKKKRLKDWLQEANGVGGQTEARIMKVFERNNSVNSNPYSLYNFLEEETSASGSYINTIVDDVFEPEREHEDVLEGTGYTPFFQRSQGGGQFANQQQGMGGQGGGPMSSQGYSQPRGGGRQNNQPRQQQQRTQQQPQQPQDSGSDDSLSQEEVAQMITHGINTAKEESEENPIRDGLSDATDDALREMASNVGSMAGTANKVFETALMSYAQENPDMIVENMDVLQSILGAADDGGSSDNQERQPENERRVDQAINQIGQGGNPNRNQQNRQPQQQQQQRQPQTQANVGHDVGPGQSGFEPESSSPTQNQPDNNTQEQESNTQEPKTEQPPEPPDEEPPEQMPTPSGSDSNSKEPESEDEAFDELFGDMQ